MDNADLEKLKIAPGKLTPKFNASVTEYKVTVGSSVSEVKLTLLTSDSGASYTIKGTGGGGKVVRLAEGEVQDVKITVSAEDGTTTKTYTVGVNRLSPDDATLSQLEVSTGSLDPAFSPSVLSYKCALPCSVDTLTLTAKTEEAATKVSMADNTPVGTLQLNPGCTIAVIVVVSASGKESAEYSITFEKSALPPTLRLKSKAEQFECAVCCCVVNKATRIRNGPYVYCQDCLEELTRTNKLDPFTDRQLEEEDWMERDFECDMKLGAELGVCPLPTGPVEAPVNQMGSKFMEAGKKIADMPTEGCKDCSKKVPHSDMALHRELLCTAKHPLALEKQKLVTKVWEKRLVDETIGNNASELVKKGQEWEKKYLQSLPYPGENARYEADQAPLDHLMRAVRAYATALSSSPKDDQTHLALGLVLEELFYAKDIFGLSQEQVMEDGEGGEGEAEASSKEEEFHAICKLHGVLASAPIALQLKAVESEYQSLKEAGQTHSADHVQALYAWKSKKVLEAGQGSYAVDKESPLYKAKLKYQDAVSTNPSNGEACYHLGRLCLLLGDKKVAKEYLMAAVALKPTLPAARFCLGLVLSNTHTKTLLMHGLTEYLAKQRVLYETHPEPYRQKVEELHAVNFFSPTNTLIFDGFLLLASLSGHSHLSTTSCLLSVTSCVAKARLHHRGSTYERLHWSSLKARSVLLKELHKEGDPSALRHCRQLSALISSSGLESTPPLRQMQMEVFQLGVVLRPSSSEALYHLGNGQLMQYDATNESCWLKEAELSFRASIEMEGKTISPTLVPDKLQEQAWWKKRVETKSQAKTTPSTSSSSASKVPPPGGAAGNKKPTTTTTKSQSVAKQPPVGGRGKPAGPASTAASRTGGRSVAAATTKTTTTSGAKKPGGEVGGAKGPSKPGSRASVPASTASSKPVQQRSTGPSKPVQRSSVPAGRGASVTSGKTVATLGELKAGASKDKPASSTGQNTTDTTKASTTPSPSSLPQEEKPLTSPPASSKAGEVNTPSHHPRLGLARTLTRSDQQQQQIRREAREMYEATIIMSPHLHDPYIELGAMLAEKNPRAAVEVYAQFPFQEPPTFDDAFLHGEIIQLLMKNEDYDNPRLITSMIAMGRALGIGVLEKQVSILENKGRTSMLKTVYAGVHSKSVNDPDLQAFFKFKCWL